MPDFQSHVPQRIEHELDHALGPGARLVLAQEQEVDVGRRREHVAAIAPDREHGETLALGRVACPENVRRRVIVERGNHGILHRRQKPRRVQAVGTLLEAFLRDHPAPEKRGMEEVERPGPCRRLVADIVERGGGELDPQLAPVDNIIDAPLARHLARLCGCLDKGRG